MAIMATEVAASLVGEWLGTFRVDMSAVAEGELTRRIALALSLSATTCGSCKGTRSSDCAVCERDWQS